MEEGVWAGGSTASPEVLLDVGSVQVRLLPEGKIVEIDVGVNGLKASDVLKRLGMNEEIAVVIREGSPLLPGDTVKPGDRIEVVRVLSGGQM